MQELERERSKVDEANKIAQKLGKYVCLLKDEEAKIETQINYLNK
jgi:hypothetical protein